MTATHPYTSCHFEPTARRRTLLLDGAAVQPRSRSAAAVADLQIADSPCRVFLSATGRMVRAALDAGNGIVPPARRSKHDAIRSAVDTTTRGDLGAVTTSGRLIRFTPVDLPSVPANSVQLAAGTRADQAYARTRKRAAELAAEGDAPSPELGASLRERRTRFLHVLTLAAILAAVFVMIFKPGA